MARAGGSRGFSALLEAIRVLARRPTTATSSGELLGLDEAAGGDEEPPIEEYYVDYDSGEGEYFPAEGLGLTE
eukprot:5621164-Alexandrium_andersonii.AAC.1